MKNRFQKIVAFFLMSVCVVFSVFIGGGGGQANVVFTPVVSLSEKINGFNPIPYFSHWRNEGGVVAFDLVLKKYNDGEFIPVASNIFNAGFDDAENWFQFSIKNLLPRDRMILMEVEFGLLNELSVFCQGKSGKYKRYDTGDNRAFSSKSVKVRNFVIPISLYADLKINCFLSARSNNNIALPVKLFDPISFVEKKQQEEQIIGMVYGAIILMIGYGVLLFGLYKRMMYLYFSLHGLFGLFYMSILNGSFSEFWINMGLQDVGPVLFIQLALITTIMFCMKYLELKKGSMIFSVGLVLTGLAVVIGILSFFLSIRISYGIQSIVVSISVFYIIYVGIIRWIDGFKPAQLFLLAFTMMFLLTIWMVLNLYVLHSDINWLHNVVNMVWLAEIIVLSIAVGERSRNVDFEKLKGSSEARFIHQSQVSDKKLIDVFCCMKISIKGVVDLVSITAKSTNKADQQRYIETANRVGEGLMAVTSDMHRIDVSDIDAANEIKKTIDLKELFFDICAVYELERKNKGVEIRCYIEKGTPTILVGNSDFVQQIILNCVSDILKNTRSSEIFISVLLTDQINNDRVVLNFEVKCFDADGARKHKIDDSKFSFCQALISRIGGEMGVVNYHDAEWCWWFQLPLMLGRDPEIAYDRIEISWLNGKPIKDGELLKEISEDDVYIQDSRVLVVEDNEINRNVIIGFLNKMGVEPEVANNGLTAVDKIQSNHHRYDLILMDCEMPVMNGYEAASRIVKWEKVNGLPSTPIIALSAHAMDRHRNMALESGMVSYVAKPITFKQFYSKISPYLNSD